MPQQYYGAIEMTFSFGVVLVIAVWQLVSLEKAKRKTREKAARRTAAPANSDEKRRRN